MRRKPMQKWLCKGTFLAIVTVLTLTGAARVQAGTCSDRSLRGNYGFTISGALGQAPNLIPLEGVAITHFDGRGHLSQVDFTVRNGVPLVPASPRPDGFGEDETGTYTVNADCTGTATIHFPDGRELDLTLVVAKGGREVHTVVSATRLPNGTTAFATTRSHGVRVGHADDDDDDRDDERR
jgi:hypothetical protein